MPVKFLEVECPDCKTVVRTYERASTYVKCPKCGRLLVEPTGGKVKILGRLVREIVWKS
ncbi:MAG: 30S ribosomal protein S27e [bacterium]|nr:30S ribosomal protein S27e [bacterium]